MWNNNVSILLVMSTMYGLVWANANFYIEMWKFEAWLNVVSFHQLHYRLNLQCFSSFEFVYTSRRINIVTSQAKTTHCVNLTLIDKQVNLNKLLLRLFMCARKQMAVRNFKWANVFAASMYNIITHTHTHTLPTQFRHNNMHCRVLCIHLTMHVSTS